MLRSKSHGITIGSSLKPLLSRNESKWSSICCCVVHRYVFFLDPCNIDIIQRKIKSMALCVSQCPTEELATYSDLKRFAMMNGESVTL